MSEVHHICVSRDKIENLGEDVRNLHLSVREVERILASNTAILAVNTESLKTHIKRTELLEVSVDKQSAFLNKMLGAFIILQILIPYLLSKGGF